MLKQRVITALALLAVLLPALFYPQPVFFDAVMLVMMVAAAWEWGRLNSPTSTNTSTNPTLPLNHPLAITAFSVTAWLGALLCAAGCLAIWAAGGLERPLSDLRWWWTGAGVFWVVASVFLLAQGVSVWLAIHPWLRLALGWLALLTAWWAVAQARGIGIEFLLSVLTLVWMADIAAYFFGRALGGRMIQRKLAVRISPGKSWEGALGGLFGVILMAVVWAHFDSGMAPHSLYGRLTLAGWPFALISVLFLGVMSVAGDLVESLIKRAVGVKDSSGLLPGHGGVLDRIDALLPVLPLSMMLAAWVSPLAA